MLSVVVKRYPRDVDLDDPVAALVASLAHPQDVRPPAWEWRFPVPKDRATIGCDNCSHRIVWWTTDIRAGWLGLQDLDKRGWKWQGQQVPVRFHGLVVDVECQRCGWKKAAAARQPDPWWQSPPEIL